MSASPLSPTGISRNVGLKRATPLHRYTRLESGKPLVRTARLQKVNPERKAKVAVKRAKQRRSPEENAARREGWIRAAGVCECGCGKPLDTESEARDPGHPEWHHPTTRSYETHRGLWLRRECHHRIELLNFPHRHGAGRTY